MINAYEQAIERITMPVTESRTPDNKRVLVDFTGREIATVSDNYALVQNADIIKPFVSRFGIESVKRVTQYGRNKYSHVSIATGREFSFDYNGERDTIAERLIIENSYNKTRSFRFMFGAFRSVCANGLYQGQAVAAIRRVHSGRIDVPGIVSSVLDSYEANSFDLWRNFQACPMTLAEERALCADFKPFNEASDTVNPDGSAGVNEHARLLNQRLAACADRWITRDESLDNQRNAWGLLNGLNRAIAANLKTPSALPRLISANLAAEKHVAGVLTRVEV